MKRYIIGLNVNDSSELPQASLDIKEFVKNLGKAEEMEIQISINPLLVESGGTANAIGFHTEEILHTDQEEYYEEEYPEDKLNKCK